MDQPVPGTPEAQLAAWKQGIEERLRALETAPRISTTSQRGGSYILLDDDGREVVFFGEYLRGSGDPGYGFQVQVPDGAGPSTQPTVIEVDDDGLEAPYLDFPLHKSDAPVIVTSGTFINTWDGGAALVVARAIQVGVTITTDGGTTGEARVTAGTVTSSAHTLPSGSSAYYAWDLLLEEDTLGSGPLFVAVQARRTSGAGNVYVYQAVCAQAGDNGIGATVTGL